MSSHAYKSLLHTQATQCISTKAAKLQKWKECVSRYINDSNWSSTDPQCKGSIFCLIYWFEKLPFFYQLQPCIIYFHWRTLYCFIYFLHKMVYSTWSMGEKFWEYVCHLIYELSFHFSLCCRYLNLGISRALLTLKRILRALLILKRIFRTCLPVNSMNSILFPFLRQVLKSWCKQKSWGKCWLVKKWTMHFSPG